MKAVEIMSTDIVTIDSLATIGEAARVMKQNNIRALIVDRNSEQDAYGIITATDISQAVANANNPATTYVCEVMTKPCIVVNPDLAVEHIAQLFAKAKIRIAPVIKDQLLGIISLTDILTKTDCLTSSQKIQKSTKLSLDKLRETALEIERESEYDNWCSG
jgi:CBS domain-containing protein